MNKKEREKVLATSNYTPNRLIDEVKKHLGIFTDENLASHMEVSKAEISNLRIMKITLTEKFVLRFHMVSGLGVDYIRHLAGDDSEDFYKRPVGERFNYRWENE